MFTALLIIDILVCLGLIGLILVQHGKGADVGAAFGSGASQTVFGSGGSGSFLTRATAILALVFFVVSLSLSYLAGHRATGKNFLDAAPSQTAAPQTAPAPAAPASDLPASLLQGAKPDEIPAAAAPVAPTPSKPADVPAR